MRIKALLLVILLILVNLYHCGCIQTKNYKVELTEEDKAEIIKAVSEEMATEQQNQEAEQK